MSNPAPITVVTGAAGALGRAVTGELAARGHRVVAVDPHAGGLDALAAEHGDALLPALLDPDAKNAWSALMSMTEARFGVPDGAVLCAGGWAGGSPVADEPDGTTLRRMLELNLETARAAIAALLPGMVRRRRGSVVVIGSRAVARPYESGGAAAYAAAKSALVTYTQAVAAETLGTGVRLNAVLPSIIDTAPNRAAMPKADHDRWVPPARLAKVIAFLLSGDAADVSGAALPVYGGI